MKKPTTDFAEYRGFKINKYELPDGIKFTFTRPDGRWCQQWYGSMDEAFRAIDSAREAINMDWGRAFTSVNLKEARESVGLTIKQAAEYSGTPYRTWRSWEDEGRDGRRPPGIAFSWLALWVKQHQGS